MAIRIILLGLMLVSLPGLAQKEGKAAAQRTALIGTLARGTTVAIDGEEYRHLPEVFALHHQRRSQSSAQVLLSLGHRTDAFVEDKGPYIIFRKSTLAHSAAAASVGTSVVYPTVLNLRTSTIGILSGTLVAQLRNMAEAEHVAWTHNIDIERTFPHLRTVFYKVKVGRDVLAALTALRADSRVPGAYPEIVEHVAVPH